MVSLPLQFSWGGDVFFGPGEIHYDHDDIMQRYQTGDKTALADLKKLCQKNTPLAFYSCYHAARLEAEAGQSRSSDELLERALKLKPDFTEALNFAIRRESSALSAGENGLVYFEKAAKAARGSNASLALEYIRQAIAHGVSNRLWYEGHPDFQRLKKNSRFRALVNNLPIGESRAELVKRISASHDSARLFDPAYTLQRHRQQPDSGELLYHYFEAYEKIRDPEKALEHLKAFIEQLERLDKEQRILVGYAVVYLWQHDRFRFLREHRESVAFLKESGKRYGIPGSFFE